jgi:hypothetical protein
MIDERRSMPSIDEGTKAATGEGRNISAVVIAAVLAVVVIALGAWIIYDRATTPTVPGNVEALIEDYLTAWENHDEQAIRAVVTNEYVLNEYLYIAGTDLADPEKVKLSYHVADDIDGVVRVGFTYDWQNELVGEPIVSGDGPWLVSYQENWFEGGTSHLDGMATYVVVDDSGTLKIANHYWTGQVRYEPIDW